MGSSLPNFFDEAFVGYTALYSADWKQENLEGKAVLRSVMAGGRWPAFRAHYLHTKRRRHRVELFNRVHAAIAKGQLAPISLDQLDTAPAAEAHAKAA